MEIKAIKYSKFANKDIEGILDYISQDNIEKANKVINIIFTKINTLKEFPLMGASIKNKIGINSKYRYIICNKYLVLYLIEDETIKIDRIIHGSRDYIQKIDFTLDN